MENDALQSHSQRFEAVHVDVKWSLSWYLPRGKSSLPCFIDLLMESKHKELIYSSNVCKKGLVIATRVPCVSLLYRGTYGDSLPSAGPCYSCFLYGPPNYILSKAQVQNYLVCYVRYGGIHSGLIKTYIWFSLRLISSNTSNKTWKTACYVSKTYL